MCDKFPWNETKNPNDETMKSSVYSARTFSIPSREFPYGMCFDCMLSTFLLFVFSPSSSALLQYYAVMVRAV